MATALSVVKAAYDAFGRGDVAAILDLVADDVDWKLLGPPAIPYAGQRSSKADVARFFAEVGQADDTQLFEPREFIEAGEHVTVLGFERFMARQQGKLVETDWIHVFTVRGGKITRWRGCYDTAARFL
ncbi:nuclear transport factor 2 family protein [Cupriavidus sp. BIC8F]|uniref:nuclear transport factor 2 family protein n=1 Tax=Cupriavidus sp. BIC8F TaxID=3079014 RepID=UPI002916437D|nr:nuclear transport factor 2 family protein [Cupriavidus sp. BIC8F]